MINKMSTSLKYIILLIVAFISVGTSAVIYASYSPEGNTIEKLKKVGSNKTLQPVVLETEYDLEEGYVDLYITSKEPVSLLELVFTKSSGISMKALSSADLFADYLKSDVAKTIRVAGTGGPTSEVVKTTDRELFARLEIEGLNSPEDLVIDIMNSSAITPEDKVLKIVEL